MITIGRELRDFTKQTIKMGGRPDRPWAPLSPWTVRRTGRHQPLVGTEGRIRYRASKDFAEVYEVEDGFAEWDLEQHGRGWYIPERVAQGRAMRIPQGGSIVYLTRAKGAYVAPRPFWPTWQQTEDVALDAVESWVRDGARKLWR